MIHFFLIIFLALLLLLSVSLEKVYKHVPAKELKRRARGGDELSELLYKAVGYGQNLEVFLWVVAGLSGSVLALLLSRWLPWPIAILIISALAWFLALWLPSKRHPVWLSKVAKYSSPLLHWLLERLHPLLNKISKAVHRLQPVSIHTGLYSKEDIIELIEQQKVQIDNRVTKEELYIVTHALRFGDKNVSEAMTPRRVMKTVSTRDMLGPVLLKELHDSGHSRFPVYQENENDIIGTLYLRDAITAKEGGFVKDITRKEVFYVNETHSLARVLDAFIKTKHHQFLVVNNFEEIVGLITIEDIVEQILGKQIIDEFDAYDDLREVAAMEAKKDEKKREQAVAETNEEDAQASPDKKTVVESDKKSTKKPDKDKRENTK